MITVRLYTSASVYVDYTNVKTVALCDDGRAVMNIDNGDGKTNTVTLPATAWSVIATKPAS